RFELPQDECVSTDDDNLLRKAYIKRPGLSFEDALSRNKAWMSLLELPRTMPQARLPEYLWDLINWNEEALVADSIHMEGLKDAKKFAAGPYHIVSDDNVFVGSDVSLSPGVVLDGSRGPVVVARGCTIGANSVLRGR